MDKKEVLRHWLAAIGFRYHKSIQGLNSDFATYDPGHGFWTPQELVQHINDVLSLARAIILESGEKHELGLPWEEEQGFVFKQLKDLDQLVQERTIPESSLRRLIQGPFSDVLTHIGQLNLLRRFYGEPGEPQRYSTVSLTEGQFNYGE